MKIVAYFKKTFRENMREWKILIMTLLLAPAFVYLMYAYFGATNPSYSLLIINEDRPILPAAGKAESGAPLRAGVDLISAWSELKYPDGKPVFRIRPIDDVEAGKRLLKNHDADLMIVIPEGFSQSITAYRTQTAAAMNPVQNIGDLVSPRFMIAASFADFVTYTYIADAAGVELPEVVSFEGIGTDRSPTDFDLYVPALLVLAVIMVLFTAAASIIKEVDKGTITRLVLSKLTTLEFLSAVSLNQLLVGTAALALTYLSALSIGYQSTGSPILFIAVGAVSILSIIAISLIVTGFIRTIYELLTVGVFPFFILMFFSEMFPLPRVQLFHLAGNVFYANDVLPTALTVKAFNKILNFGAGPGDVAFEIISMIALTVLYFAAGLWIFKRRHLRAR
jgi:ABC-2 type transport system permease protein